MHLDLMSFKNFVLNVCVQSPLPTRTWLFNRLATGRYDVVLSVLYSSTERCDRYGIIKPLTHYFQSTVLKSKTLENKFYLTLYFHSKFKFK